MATKVMPGLKEDEVPFLVVDTRVTKCRLPNCDRLIHARRLCRAHYLRLTQDGDVRADVPIKEYTPKGAAPNKCYNEHCQEKAFCHDLCKRHYNHIKRKK